MKHRSSGWINIAFIGLAIIALASCDNDDKHSKDNDSDVSELAFAEPLIQTNDLFPGSNWNDPHVLHDGSQFIMYASASQNFDYNIKIYRMVSDNGIDWTLSPTTPVLERSPSGWDSKSVETPAVVYYNGQYHMFYTGYETEHTDVGNYRIGHATSYDGITWFKNGYILEPTAPYGDINMDFNQFNVAEPGPVVHNGKIYLYFTAIGANARVATILQVIGLTTFDGNTWSQPVSVIEPDPDLYPRDAYYGYSTPNAIVRGGKVHLYYSVVADPWRQVKLHRAVSSNGIDSWHQDDIHLLAREDHDWTLDEVRSPSVLEHDNKLYLYFAGHTATNLGIGLRIFCNANASCD